MKHQDSMKLAALQLTTLNWMQRAWVMSKLPVQKRKAIKPFVKQLKRFNRHERKLALQNIQRAKSASTEHIKVEKIKQPTSNYPYLNKIASGEIKVKSAVLAMCLDEINS